MVTWEDYERKPLEAKAEAGELVNGRPFEKRDFRQELEKWKQHRWFWEVIDDLLTARPAPADALREALEKVTVRMNKVTARWRHTKRVDKTEMDNLCNIQLDADAALRGTGEVKKGTREESMAQAEGAEEERREMRAAGESET